MSITEDSEYSEDPSFTRNAHNPHKDPHYEYLKPKKFFNIQGVAMQQIQSKDDNNNKMYNYTTSQARLKAQENRYIPKQYTPQKYHPSATHSDDTDNNNNETVRPFSIT